MADVYRLFNRGLRWSYREYGLKGVVAFLVGAAAIYYLVDQAMDDSQLDVSDMT